MYKFRDLDVTMVSACALIEDWQRLKAAVRDPGLSREELEKEINVVLDCLADTISGYTRTPGSRTSGFTPSASSLVAMSCDNGILVQEDGSDFECAAGKPVSGAMYGECCQCPDDCPHLQDCSCDPENGILKLACGFTYDGTNGEELLAFLDGADEDDEDEAEGDAEELLDVIDNAVALAGYKVLEGDRDEIYVKGADGVHYSIKIKEVAG